MNDSYIKLNKDGNAFGYVGSDGVRVVQALTLASALKLWAGCGMLPTRGVGITQMLAMAEGFTGKKYKRKQALEASQDVKRWADEMKAALPVLDHEGKAI